MSMPKPSDYLLHGDSSKPHAFPFTPAKTSFTPQEVREQLWALVRDKRHPHHPWTYRTQAELANAIGVSAPFLNEILNGNREPSGKVLDFLKLERVVRYEVTRS